jgi:hypothetical protein
LAKAACAQSASGEVRPSPLLPPGVGNCIYEKIGDQTRRLAVDQAAAGHELPSMLSSEIGRVAPQCTGRPFSSRDRGVIAASLAVILRNGSALRLKTTSGVLQDRLDAAWREASPDDQAPYLAAARAFLDGEGKIQPPEIAAIEPFRTRLKVTDSRPGVTAGLNAYFYATALGEISEARLAGPAPR